MLYSLIFALFCFSFNALKASCPQEQVCPIRRLETLIQGSLQVVEKLKQDKDFQSFAVSLQKREPPLKNVDSLESMMAPQAPGPLSQPLGPHVQDSPEIPGELIIFVSFSMGEKALTNLAQEAKDYGATLVLRGFREGSYVKTAKALQKVIEKTGQGFVIDPELFTLFSITAVPTTVLSRPFQVNASERSFTPLHDRLQGHVSLRYALEAFAKDGDLKEEAQAWLRKGAPQ